MSEPWFKFYPKDWKADAGLRLCPLSARGLWIEMLAIMHESNRYGHLIVAGQILDDASLAALIGAPTHEVSDNLRRLEQAGVFTRSSDGAIYSRKMVRDFKRSNVNRKNVKKRWENNSVQNADDKGENLDRNTTRNTRKISEARSQKESKYAFAGKVIRLNQRDWDSLMAKSGMSAEGFGTWLCGKDDYYSTLAEHERAEWWQRVNNAIKGMKR